MPDETSQDTTQPETPATPAAPAPAAAAAAPAKQASKGQKRGPEIRIPQAAFKSRIDREAAAQVRKRLGVTLEEAERLIKQGGTASGNGSEGSAVAQTVDQAVAQYKAENEKLRKQLDLSRRQTVEWQNKHKKDTTRLKDRQIEAELKAAAAKAGVVDTDYALHLFAREAAQGKATDPTEYFGGLKATHAYLFSTPTAPPAPPEVVAVEPSTAPPESAQPGEATPKPAPAGAPAPVTNAESMDPQQFNRHLRSYGYTPGM